MALTGYDLKKKINYISAYGHYYFSYRMHIPPYKYYTRPDLYGATQYHCVYDGSAAVDGDSSFEEFTGDFGGYYGNYPTNETWDHSANGTVSEYAYFVNPHKDAIGFSEGNCSCEPVYTSKAPFAVTIGESGYINRVAQTLTAASTYMAVPVQYSILSATVYYKKTADSAYTSVAASVTGDWSNTTLTFAVELAMDTFYNVYIVATADDGSTATSNVGTFSTIDSAAVAHCVSPSGSQVVKDVTFIWTHSNSYGSPQYAADVQYKSSSDTDWTVVCDHVIGTDKTATATLLEAGVYEWRVRTYNQSDVAGAWSSTTFVNMLPANPPENLAVTTKGRPTVTWTSDSQSAYQVVVERKNGEVVYDSGAVYLSDQKHFINQYFGSEIYSVKVRIYNQLGSVSEYSSVDYQQPAITQVAFTLEQYPAGGAAVTITENTVFTKYYLRRNGKTIKSLGTILWTVDKYAVGQTTYEVVGVTAEDQSSVVSGSVDLVYPRATIITTSGLSYAVNKRVNSPIEISTSISADIDTESYLGASKPSHYPSKMRTKAFGLNFFDAEGIAESLLGTVIFYADNFGNGGWCIAGKLSKSDSFDKFSSGKYANEIQLTLEETDYDDSIQYTV